MSRTRRLGRAARRLGAASLGALSLGLCCGETPTSSTPGSPDPGGFPSTVTASAAVADETPNYLWSFDGLQLQVDARLIVQGSSTGNIVLRLAHSDSLPGNAWRIFDARERCCTQYTFSNLDIFYKTIPPIAEGQIPGRADVVLPWRQFGLLDATLPTQRQLLVQRVTDSGRPSYALFEFNFPAPQ